MAESQTDQEQGFKMPEAHEKHRLFEPLAGTFKSKVSMFMGPEPTVSSGTIVNSLHILSLIHI